MDAKDPEELLRRIARVDPPPFLFTRIGVRLAENGPVPRARAFAVACGLVLLLLVNVAVIARAGRSRPALAEVADGMGFAASNQLYR